MKIVINVYYNVIFPYDQYERSKYVEAKFVMGFIYYYPGSKMLCINQGIVYLLIYHYDYTYIYGHSS
jgi:hypothetical protein